MNNNEYYEDFDFDTDDFNKKLQNAFKYFSDKQNRTLTPEEKIKLGQQALHEYLVRTPHFERKLQNAQNYFKDKQGRDLTDEERPQFNQQATNEYLKRTFPIAYQKITQPWLQRQVQKLIPEKAYELAGKALQTQPIPTQYFAGQFEKLKPHIPVAEAEVKPKFMKPVQEPITQYALGLANELTFGVPELIFGKTKTPETVYGEVSKGAGMLTGFIFGPAKLTGIGVDKAMKVASKGVLKAIPDLAKPTSKAFSISEHLAKNLLHQTLTIGIASGLLQHEGASLDENVQNRLKAIRDGMAMGAIFGTAPAFEFLPKIPPVLTKAIRLGTGLTAIDLLTGRKPTDQRELFQKTFDYGLNTIFLLGGPTAKKLIKHKGFMDALYKVENQLNKEGVEVKLLPSAPFEVTPEGKAFRPEAIPKERLETAYREAEFKPGEKPELEIEYIEPSEQAILTRQKTAQLNNNTIVNSIKSDILPPNIAVHSTSLESAKRIALKGLEPSPTYEGEKRISATQMMGKGDDIIPAYGAILEGKAGKDIKVIIDPLDIEGQSGRAKEVYIKEGIDPLKFLFVEDGKILTHNEFIKKHNLIKEKPPVPETAIEQKAMPQFEKLSNEEILRGIYDLPETNPLGKQYREEGTKRGIYEHKAGVAEGAIETPLEKVGLEEMPTVEGEQPIKEYWTGLPASTKYVVKIVTEARKLTPKIDDFLIKQIHPGAQNIHNPIFGMKVKTNFEKMGLKGVADSTERYRRGSEQDFINVGSKYIEILKLLGDGKEKLGIKRFPEFFDYVEGKRNEPKFKNEFQARKLINNLMNEIAGRLEGVGEETWDFNPETQQWFRRPFKRIEGNYMPHKWKWDTQTREKAINNIMKRYGVKEGQAKDILNEIMGDEYSLRYTNSQIARIFDMPEYRKDAGVIWNYLLGVTKRMNWLKEFGQDLRVTRRNKQFIISEKLSDALERLKTNTQEQYFLKAMQRISGREPLPTGLRKVYPIIRTAQLVKLGFSAIPNAFQHFTNTWATVGTIPYLNALWETVTSKRAREWAKTTGAISPEKVLSLTFAAESGRLRKFADVFLKICLFHQTESLNRIVSALSAKEYTPRLLEKYKEATRRKEWYKEEIEKLFPGESEQVIKEYLKEGYLSEKRLKDAGWGLSKLTQFVADAESLPLFWSSPEGKVITQFKNFAYNQTALLHNEGLRPFLEFCKTGGQRGNLNIVKFLPAITLAGFITKTIRDKITGRKELTEDEGNKYAKMLGFCLSAGGLGIAFDALMSMQFGKSGVYDLLGGPTFSDIAMTMIQISKMVGLQGKLKKGQRVIEFEKMVARYAPWAREALERLEPTYKTFSELNQWNRIYEGIRKAYKETFIKKGKDRADALWEKLCTKYEPEFYKKYGKRFNKPTDNEVEKYFEEKKQPYKEHLLELMPGSEE